MKGLRGLTKTIRWFYGDHPIPHRSKPSSINSCAGADVQNIAWPVWNQMKDGLVLLGKRNALVPFDQRIGVLGIAFCSSDDHSSCVILSHGAPVATEQDSRTP